MGVAYGKPLYTLQITPRKSRTGRTARDSARSVIVQVGAANLANRGWPAS